MKFRLKDLREDRDLRQINVAEATGIDQRTLSNYETGKTLPGVAALICLADFFGVTIDYLVGRAEASVTAAERRATLINGIRVLLDRLEQT
ncbi:MAG: helix-turn-helix transcriptional regulator [Clostridia bacterium]|nr:helix-turn-helix transcriptional regulator [Clostridia bacterium]